MQISIVMGRSPAVSSQPSALSSQPSAVSPQPSALSQKFFTAKGAKNAKGNIGLRIKGAIMSLTK
jgi:hypothetical protein